jgi:hypothetical protein
MGWMVDRADAYTEHLRVRRGHEERFPVSPARACLAPCRPSGTGLPCKVSRYRCRGVGESEASVLWPWRDETDAGNRGLSAG